MSLYTEAVLFLVTEVSEEKLQFLYICNISVCFPHLNSPDMVNWCFWHVLLQFPLYYVSSNTLECQIREIKEPDTWNLKTENRIDQKHAWVYL